MTDIVQEYQRDRQKLQDDLDFIKRQEIMEETTIRLAEERLEELEQERNEIDEKIQQLNDKHIAKLDVLKLCRFCASSYEQSNPDCDRHGDR